MTFKDRKGRYIFRERLLNCLRENEDIYYEYLQRHFRRHIEPLI
ncbi:MAG: tagaturonate epimerase family protein [Fidelibacterota bacterium]